MKLLIRFARASPDIVGSPLAFLLAVVSVVLWLVVGPLVGFSDAWLVFPATATWRSVPASSGRAIASVRRRSSGGIADAVGGRALDVRFMLRLLWPGRRG